VHKREIEMKKWGKVLCELGFFGLGAVEEAIVAALITGDPLLMIGKHGTAKTAVCREVAKVLGLEFNAYDASKALFDDVVGYPSPKALTEGRVEYLESPVTLWNKSFVLIDELSRANPQMQNKWLEVIRSHTLMGVPLKKLRYVFAAMNPTNYVGAMQLDEALVTRFAFIVDVPDIHQMVREDAISAIHNVGEDDARELGMEISGRPGNGPIHERLKHEIEERMKQARSRLVKIDSRFGKAIEEYVLSYSMELDERGLYLSFRTMGMIRRNILVYLAMDGGDFKNLMDAEHVIRRAMAVSLPFKASGIEMPGNEIMELIHQSALDEACSSMQIKSGKNIPRGRFAGIMGRSMEGMADLGLDEQFLVVNSIIENHAKAQPKDLPKNTEILTSVCRSLNEFGVKTAPEVTEHLFDHAAAALGIVDVRGQDFVEVQKEMKRFNAGSPERCRLVRTALIRTNPDFDDYRDIDETVTLLRQIDEEAKQ